jgi:hypothetical protein
MVFSGEFSDKCCRFNEAEADGVNCPLSARPPVVWMISLGVKPVEVVVIQAHEPLSVQVGDSGCYNADREPGRSGRIVGLNDDVFVWVGSPKIESDRWFVDGQSV